mmetsp:Transcript_14136/g.17077  ORF Transcript_14136/g.17077 Transcript_14136/m.17077 type:complete len:411 (+) Transcript_14136:93-1325(+)
MPSKNSSYIHVDCTEGDEAILSKIPVGLKVLDISDMYFAVISSKRSKNVEDMEKALEGCNPTWIVGSGEVDAYKAQGASNVVEGGSLCASRNLALEKAFAENKPCVQLSDDLQQVCFYHHKRDYIKPFVKPSSLTEANKIAAQSDAHAVSLAAAARALEAHARSRNSYLAGTFPNGNAGQACAGEPIFEEHFIVGDFIVVRPSIPRFDPNLTLKEDYDFTAQHLIKYEKVTRWNRVTLFANHYTNEGGAVAIRNTKREKQNIKYLRSKWPGVFLNSPRGPCEVVMAWRCRDITIGGTRIYEPDPKQPGRALQGQAAAVAREKRIARKKKKKSQKQNTKFLHQNNSVTDSCATEVELEDHSNEVENMSDVVSSSSYSKKRKSDSAQLDAPNKSLRTRKTRTSMAATAAACT